MFRKNKRGLITLLSGLTFASLVSTFVATFAWLSVSLSSNLEIAGFVSSSLAAYFDDKGDGTKGEGTESDPFLIREPVTLYNLAWLQYLGQINTVDEESNNYKEYYFKLDADIDMSGWYLPPIGTKDYPFISSFNGGGHAISNLVVSNEFDELDNEAHPAPILEEDYHGVNIIGLFGVVGTFEGKAGTLKGFKYNSSTTEVKNLIIDNLEVKSQAQTTLMGIIAGYVNAESPSILNDMHYSIDYVGISNSYLSVGSGVSALPDKLNTISNYSAIGWCNSDYYKTIKLNLTGETEVRDPDEVTGGEGDENANGGTIDLVGMCERIVHMKNSGNATSFNFVSGTTNSLTIPFQNDKYVQIAGTTYLPINVENDITLSYYQNNASKGEVVSENNAGYIVGDNGKGTNYTLATRQVNNSTDSSFGNIKNSLGGKVTLDDDAFSLYTQTASGKTRIVDSEFNSATYGSTVLSNYTHTEPAENYSQYNNVKEKMKSFINDTGYLAALRFNTSVQQNNIKKVTGTNVKMNGKMYSSYEFFPYSVNFEVQNNSKVAGVFRPNVSTGAISMCTLVELEQTKTFDRTINGIDYYTSTYSEYKLISKVEMDENKNFRYTYAYRSVNSSQLTYVEDGFDPSTSQVRYDQAWWTGNMSQAEYNSLFYVEIPLKEGTYAFSRIASSSNANAYQFVYLDLGINGDDSGDPGEGGTPIPDVDEEGNITVSMPVGHIDYIQDTSVSLESHEWYSIVEVGEDSTETEYFILPVVFRFEFIFEDEENQTDQLTITTMSSRVKYSARESFVYEGDTVRYIEALHKDSSNVNITSPVDLNIKTYLCVPGLVAADVNGRNYVAKTD